MLDNEISHHRCGGNRIADKLLTVTQIKHQTLLWPKKDNTHIMAFGNAAEPLVWLFIYFFNHFCHSRGNDNTPGCLVAATGSRLPKTVTSL